MKESHLALYRKYRPENFGGVVGQEQLVNLLVSSIKQKTISHAYLFCGGRGTGKTTVARIFARDIGCNQEDIIEIDAASNRGIDEIRELREAVRTAPFSSEYKVYIVDEAHMLTKEAANALLKTLEEPPAHVIFILATTDPEKLPDTIVSRCQKIVFKKPNIETLSLTLISVAEKEGYKLDKQSGDEIAKHGKGSYRDSLGILEQILNISGKNIKYEEVKSFLGSPEKELLISLLLSVCEKNEQSIIKNINQLKERGLSAIRAYDDFLDVTREGLMARVSTNGEENKESEEILKIAKTYPTIIGSKLLLGLLENRHLIEVSENHSWTAFLAILINSIEK